MHGAKSAHAGYWSYFQPYLVALTIVVCGIQNTFAEMHLEPPQTLEEFTDIVQPDPVRGPDWSGAVSPETSAKLFKAVDRSMIISPTEGSTLSSTTTFRWSDQEPNQYLFRLSAVSCFEGDIVNQFSIPGTTTSFTATGVSNTQIIYASIWAQASSGGSYMFRDCATYNTDFDGDGFFNDIDPEPNTFNPLTTYEKNGTTLRVAPTERVSVLKISAGAYDALSAGNTDNLEAMTRLIYEFYEDDFDFIFFTQDQVEADASYFGRYHSVQNDVSGIGSSLFSRTASWGSGDPDNNDGRLQGAIHYPTLTSFSRGPGLHELMHRWANRLSAIPDGGTGSHWGFSSGGGQLGGWVPSTVMDLGSNQYRANNGRSSSFGLVANGGNGLAYSNIELYLMGMIPQSELQDMQYATNASWVDTATGTFMADSLVTVSPSELVGTDGVRQPDSASAQKSFRILNVLLTKSNATLREIGTLDEQTYRFGLAGDEGTSSFNFWEATGGRGTLVMSLSDSSLKAELEPEPEPDDADEQCFVVANGKAVFCL